MIVCVSVVGHQVKKQLTLHSDFWFDATLTFWFLNFGSINRTIRFTYRASPTLMMPSSSTTSFIAPSTSSKSEVGHFHVSPFVFLFVCIASLFSFCLFKRWCQSVSFSEQSQNHIERGFSWPTLSYTQLQSVSTKPCLILSLSVDTYISLGPFLFLLQVWLLD